MSWIDFLIVALYLLGTLYLGFVLHKKASENIDQYFLADRQLPWWALGASGMASNVDVAGTMVIAALVYALGTKGLFIEIRGGIVLILPFFMTFLGKWTRRAKVMTSAEWMRLRFGEGREGNLARLMSAIANLVIHVWIISYFAIGGGKFFGGLLGVDDRLASIAMILVTMLYATASGFYGVVWTDVFQGGIILVGIIYLVMTAMKLPALPAEFPVSVPLGKGEFAQVPMKFSEWSTAWPSNWTLDLPGQYSAFNLFGMTVFFYFLKTSIEGFGGAGGYMSQRYFAAKSDKDAGLLSLFWISLLAFRWPLVTAIAVLALHHSLGGTALQDPEMALPTVIAQYAPSGIKGLLVACFMAAAMSTFVAVINASAAYWVKDIYQAYLNPKASEKTLVTQSRVASIVTVLLGLVFSFPVVNINDIWGWITMAFGSGLFVPLLLRWYWWRYNGYGFAAGTAMGMLAAVATRYAGVEVPEYMNFLIPGGASLLGCIVGTYATQPTSAATLKNFFSVTKPFGFWGPVRKEFSSQELARVDEDNRWDVLATFIAVPWMLAMCMAGILLVMKRWDQLTWTVGAFVVLSAALYVTWFRRLRDDI